MKKTKTKPSKAPRASMAALTLGELRILFTDEALSQNQQLMFKVAFWHGLRVSELIGLTKEGIADGYVSVQRLKGSNATVQPYQKHRDPAFDEAKELRALHKSLAPGERCFPVDRSWVRKLMQKVGERHGIPAHKMHPHALKHTIAILTIKEAGIEHVRQHLGHASIASTGAYLRVTDEQASKAISSAIEGW